MAKKEIEVPSVYEEHIKELREKLKESKRLHSLKGQVIDLRKQLAEVMREEVSDEEKKQNIVNLLNKYSEKFSN